MLCIKSATSGNLLPCIVIKKSKIRKFFNLPNVLVDALVRGLQGYRISLSWHREAEILTKDGR